MVAGSYFIIQSFSNKSPIKIQQAAVSPRSPVENSTITPVDTADLETKELATLEEPSNSLQKQHDNSAKIKENKESNLSVKPPINSSVTNKIVDEKPEPTLEDNTDNIPGIQEQETEEPGVTVPKEKKKTLAEKIDGFFEKIGNKKQKDPVVDSQPKTTEDGSEKKSKRRDDETKPLVEEIDISSLVDITANNPDNWMMGVKGLKLTLRNRSNETIKTATVEVKYYSEQNSLLEIKLVYFTNILPKKSLTIAAPDQRLADHIDFKLLAINIREDSYVKR